MAMVLLRASEFVASWAHGSEACCKLADCDRMPM